MTIKYNSPGANFTSLKNAWNENKFMKEYEQVNNPYFHLYMEIQMVMVQIQIQIHFFGDNLKPLNIVRVELV